MNVLIVDDSNIVRRVLKNSLTKYFDGDVTFFEAENGVQAVEVMKKETINIMTLDWNMPIMNGEQVVDAVRANSEWNKTRIIMATTEGTKAQVMKMLKKGVNGYLVKPFQEDKVHKMFDTVTARMQR